MGVLLLPLCGFLAVRGGPLMSGACHLLVASVVVVVVVVGVPLLALGGFLVVRAGR
ncbi:hypothetical protein [Actinokineospora sp. NPDC004072]